MPFDYAALLSDCNDKGICGLPECVDGEAELKAGIDQLAGEMSVSKHTVVVTGAGVSTAVGISDFRGPNGVWTKEKMQPSKEVQTALDMDGFCPSFTHYALRRLVEADIVQAVISQNVDGLHLKSGLDKDRLIELHGNMYIEQCDRCKLRRLRSDPVTRIGRMPTGTSCGMEKKHGYCRGKMRDTVLDWSTDIDPDLLSLARSHCQKADLTICVGTSLRMFPCGEIPKLSKKVAIVNLQKTPLDSIAQVLIHQRCDIVFSRLLAILKLCVPLVWFKPPKPQSDNPTHQALRMYFLSGKRKSGKDFIAGCIERMLPPEALSVLRVSKPLKAEYAKKHNLDLEEMLKASDYKERYRADMVRYGEQIRAADPSYFCRLAMREAQAECKPIWLLVDARRKIDLNFFREIYRERLVTIRITCSDEVRQRRNWKMNPDVDLAESECDLDDVKFDYYLDNDGQRSGEELEEYLKGFLMADMARVGLTF